MNKGMSLNLLPIISAPAQVARRLKFFSEQLASYFRRPLGVGDDYGLQSRVSFSASPGSLASHFRVNSPTGGCSSRDRQNSSARSHPPSLLQHRRGIRQQYIFSRQEGRWPPPGYKPKESEFLCELPTFQNGGNSLVTGPVKKGDFMVKLDLKDAYFTVPVWKGHQKFLRFIWKETLWEFACLPFGLASAPRTFTKIMKPVVATLRNLGYSSYYISGRPSHPSGFRADCQTPPGNSYE